VTTTSTQRKARHAAIVIELLANGDTETVAAVFRQLGPQSRRWRFGTGKRRLRPDELALLATVGSGRVVLVARAGEHPIGIALARRLAAEATAAGIVDVHALIAADNRASLALVRAAATIVETRLEGADPHLVARTPAPTRRRDVRSMARRARLRDDGSRRLQRPSRRVSAICDVLTPAALRTRCGDHRLSTQGKLEQPNRAETAAATAGRQPRATPPGFTEL
jgi:hypothetical protein